MNRTQAFMLKDLKDTWTPADGRQRELNRRKLFSPPPQITEPEPNTVKEITKIRISPDGVMSSWLEMLEMEAEKVAPLEYDFTQAPTIFEVIHKVSTISCVPIKELIGPRRHQRLVKTRQIGMYLAKKHTQKSYPLIGQKFGGRDHTTVMHACKKIARLLEERDRYAVVLVRMVEAEL